MQVTVEKCCWEPLSAGWKGCKLYFSYAGNNAENLRKVFQSLTHNFNEFWMDEEETLGIHEATSTFLVVLVLHRSWETRITSEIYYFSIQKPLIWIWTLCTGCSQGLNYCHSYLISILQLLLQQKGEKWKEKEMSESAHKYGDYDNKYERLCLFNWSFPLLIPGNIATGMCCRFQLGQQKYSEKRFWPKVFLGALDARGSAQRFLHTGLLILCCAAQSSLNTLLMWKPQPKLPLSPLSLKHCSIPASPAHLQRILFWPEWDEPRW